MTSVQWLFIVVFTALAAALAVLDPTDYAGFGFALGLTVGALILFKVAFGWMLAAGLVLLGTVLTTPAPTGTPLDILVGAMFGGCVALGLKTVLVRRAP